MIKNGSACSENEQVLPLLFFIAQDSKESLEFVKKMSDWSQIFGRL